MKEKILKEFEKTFCDISEIFEMEGAIGVKDKVKEFISNAIDQTREETIRECEDIIDKITPPYIGVLESNNDRRIYEAGCGALLEEISQSLIQLRK